MAGKKGASGGKRKGSGRQKGGRNKKTIERAIVAERIISEAGMTGTRLGKETLAELRDTFVGVAAMFQPSGTTPAEIDVWAKSSKEPLFAKYAELAMKTAEKLANYQSPKLAAIAVAAPAPEHREHRKKFTVGIFDGQGRPAPRHIDVKPTTSVTSAAKQ